MKWLIITDSNGTENVKEIDLFLKSKKQKTDIFVATEENTNIDRIIKSEIVFKKFFKNIDGVTHCIISDYNIICRYQAAIYLFGFFYGKNIPLFIARNETDEASTLSIIKKYKIVRMFKTQKLLQETIDKELHLFEEEEKRSVARQKLFKKGLPFTPDEFSIMIAENRPEECNLFLQAGMSPDVRDSAGTPMICYAARYNKKDIVSWLAQNGADINAVSKDRGYSAVMDAVWKKNEEIVELLVSLGCDLNIISKDGQSVLVLAIGNGNENICRTLIQGGANPRIKDHMGMSAYDYAKLFKKENIIKLMEENGK